MTPAELRAHVLAWTAYVAALRAMRDALTMDIHDAESALRDAKIAAREATAREMGVVRDPLDGTPLVFVGERV